MPSTNKTKEVSMKNVITLPKVAKETLTIKKLFEIGKQ